MTEKPTRKKPQGDKSGLTTMGDIARMAGVSEATVSRALSGSPVVAAKTRQRILELARATNFSVNEQARNLALGRSQTIEVIFAIEPGTLQHVSDPFFVDMLAALIDTLADQGYDVLVSKSAPWDADRPGCAFLGGRAAGVIFVGQGRHRSEIRDFARSHRQAVTWGAVEGPDDHCVVGSDNVGGGQLATEHLLKLGRRSIVFLGDPSLPEIAQRFEGYQRALMAAGVPLDDRLVISAPFDIVRARAATQPLIELYPAFDAIFAASDMIALAAIATLRDRGITVPEDVAVVGFDDISAGALVDPALTTVHQDIRGASRMLVDRLIASIAGQDAPSEIIGTRLIVRRSCGAPAP